MAMHTQTYKGMAGLCSLREQWLKLHEFCDLWSRYEWYYAYAAHLAADSEQIYFIRIIADGETVAIIPAEAGRDTIYHIRNRTVLGSARHPHISMSDFPLHPSADPTQVAAQMLEALRKLPLRWFAVRWPKIMHSAHAMRVARAMDRQQAHIHQGKLCNYIQTARTPDTLCNGFSKNLKNLLKKSRKRLTEEGEWHIVATDEQSCPPEYLDELLRIESSGWKGEAGSATAIRFDARAAAFYKTLLEQRGNGFSPSITLLLSNGTPIAAQFAIAVHGCKHILKIGYDEEYARCSPGQVLMEEVLKGACGTDGIEKASLVTNMPWHQQWHPDHDETYDILLFRSALAGRLMGGFLRMLGVVKFMAQIAARLLRRT